MAWVTMGEQGTKTGPNVELTVLHGAYHNAAYVALRKHAGYNWWVRPLRQRGGALPIGEGLTWKNHTRGGMNDSTLLLLTLARVNGTCSRGHHFGGALVRVSNTRRGS